MFEETEAFRADLREYLADEIAPVVDERDADGPMSREELVGYLQDLRELGVGVDPEAAPQYFGDRPRFAVASEEISRVWPSLNVAIQISFPALFVRHAAESTRAAELDKLGWKGVNNARMEVDDVRVPAENKLTNIVGNAMLDGHEMTEIVPFPESVTDLFAR